MDVVSPIHFSTGPHTIRPARDRMACGRVLDCDRGTADLDAVTAECCRRTHAYRLAWLEASAWRWATFHPCPRPGWLRSMAPRRVVRNLAGEQGIRAGAVFDVDLGRRGGVQRWAVIAMPAARTSDVRWLSAYLGPTPLPVDLPVAP